MALVRRTGSKRAYIHVADGSGGLAILRFTTACYDFQAPDDVDSGDIQAVTARWRLTAVQPNPDNDPNTPNYEARYDVVYDGVINIQDIQAVAA